MGAALGCGWEGLPAASLAQLTCPGAHLSTTRRSALSILSLQGQPLLLEKPSHVPGGPCFQKVPASGVFVLVWGPTTEDGLTPLRANVPCGLGAPALMLDPKLLVDSPVALLSLVHL